MPSLKHSLLSILGAACLFATTHAHALGDGHIHGAAIGYVNGQAAAAMNNFRAMGNNKRGLYEYLEARDYDLYERESDPDSDFDLWERDSDAEFESELFERESEPESELRSVGQQYFRRNLRVCSKAFHL